MRTVARVGLGACLVLASACGPSSAPRDAQGSDSVLTDVAFDVAPDVEAGSDAAMDTSRDATMQQDTGIDVRTTDVPSNDASDRTTMSDSGSDTASSDAVATDVTDAADVSMAMCAGAADGTACAGGQCCGGACVPNDALHCGATCAACAAPTSHGTASCDGTACGFACDVGYASSGGDCVAIGAPRPVWPPSGATIRTMTPAFRWLLAPNTDGAEVDVCSDRACATPSQTFDANGSTGAAAAPLALGTWFWRLRGRAGGVTGTQTSATWSFTVVPGAGMAGPPFFDVDGDGHADIVLGQKNGDVSAQPSGAVWLFYGSASGATSGAAVFDPGVGTDAQLGASAANAGDVNGDGRVDFAVGAPGYAGFGGIAYVWYGRSSRFGANPAPDATLLGTGGEFGASIAAGDLNGDGYSDLLVGAPNAGAVSVFFGGASGPGLSPAQTISMDGAFSEFGASVAIVGDVDGDGYADALVGEPNYAGSAIGYSGRALFFRGSATGLDTASMQSILPSEDLNMNASFGGGVAGAGDLDGDGFNDVVIGAPGFTMNGLADGRVYAFFGSASGLSSTPDIVLDNPLTGAQDQFGAVLGSTVDFDGDGAPDVLVTGYSDGEMYLYNGPMLTRSTLQFGNLAGTYGGLGNAFAVEDLDGDGHDDLIVGAQCAPQSSLSGGCADGEVFTYFGGTASGLLLPRETLSDTSGNADPNDAFGSAIAR